jgi:hypothetical protein
MMQAVKKSGDRILKILNSGNCSVPGTNCGHNGNLLGLCGNKNKQIN